MKKWRILIPSLLAANSAPLVSLTGCFDNPTTFVVTLFAGDGTFGQTNRLVLEKIRWGTKLSDVRGYQKPQGDFVCWMNDSIPFDEDSPIKSNIFLEASYENPSVVHTVTLFANGGSFVDSTDIMNLQVWGNKTPLKDVIGQNVPTGKTQFTGWVDKNGHAALMDELVKTDLTLKATYDDPTAVHNITLFANGGKFKDGTDILNLQVQGNITPLSEAIGDNIPTSTTLFKEWVDKNGQRVEPEQLVMTDLYLKATYNDPSIYHKIVLYANGGQYESTGSDVLLLEVQGSDTILKEVSGYTKPNINGVVSTKWIDNNGIEYKDNTRVSCDLFLRAIYPDLSITVTNPISNGIKIFEETTQPGQNLALNVVSIISLNNESVEEITINGNPISTYAYIVDREDNHRALIFIPGESIDGNINVTFREPVAPTPSNFENDSWTTVLYYAYQGMESLMKAYNKTSASQFVGLTRDLYINNQHQPVRVIGVNQDYLDEKHQTVAALTFQFEHILSSHNGEYMMTQWDANENIDYWNSTLEKHFNSKKPVHWTNETEADALSVYSMIERQDFVLANFIRNVYRGINIYDGEKFVLSTKPTKIFCPTLSNFFSPQGIESSPIIPDSDVQLYCAEGQGSAESNQYAYYALPENVGTKTFDAIHGLDCLIRKDIQGVEWYYWLTSNLIDTSKKSWCILADGLVTADNVYNDMTVVPCFCI